MLTLRFVATIIVTMGAALCAAPSFAYDKAVEGPDVVLNKLFPKKSKVELDGKFGVVLNQSYQQTFLVNGGLTYFWSEEWGFNVEGNMALTSDKPERGCIEKFYNDPNEDMADQCGDEVPTGDANYGPAYVPVRELKYIFAGNLVWNPIYGKQIILLSATNYFDFYIAMGGGIAMSDFYPNTPNLPNGNPSRGTFACTSVEIEKGECTEADKAKNPGTLDEAEIGIDGRPAAEAQSNVLAHFSIGQRFHFMKRFLVTAELKNYTLIGTPDGFENFFSLMGGFGVRF